MAENTELMTADKVTGDNIYNAMITIFLQNIPIIHFLCS